MAKARTVLEIAQAVQHRTEHVEQSFLMQRLAVMEGRHPELRLGYAVPNGGWRSKAQGGKLKAEGVRASVPDYVLPVPRWPFHGLYIEMKQLRKYGSPEQREFQRRLYWQGYAVFECQGEEAAFPVVMGYLALETWADHGFSHLPLRALMSRHLAGKGVGVTIPPEAVEG
jgi:hypothetical protein